MWLMSGLDPWSPSNALAPLEVVFRAPLEVLHGKYGPGLALLYQPCALATTFGGVRVRGALSKGVAHTLCGSPHARTGVPAALVAQPFLMWTPAVSYVIVLPFFWPIDAGLLTTALPQTWTSLVIDVLLPMQRFPWMYRGESNVVLFELLKSQPDGSPVP